MRSLKNRLFYGWVIVVVTAIVVAAGAMLWFSFSIFYVEILAEFGWGRANTAIFFALGGIIYGISSPIAGILFDRFGPRKIFPLAAVLLAAGAIGTGLSNEMWQFCLFYGIILAFGVALVGFPPAVALVSNWFIKRRAMALGFAQAGLQGTFLIAPLIQLLIQTAGWRNTYFWLAGAILLIIAPLSIGFLRHHPRDIGLSPDGTTSAESADNADKHSVDRTIVDEGWVSQEWTLIKALKTYRFWAVFTVVTTMSITFNMIVTHQVAYIVDIGFSAMFAASLLVLFGAMSMAGRFFGFVSDIFGRERTYTVCSFGIMLAILLLLLAGTASSVWMLYVYMAFFAFCAGLSTPTYGASVADVFHGRHFGSIIGFADLGWGLGTALGSWLGGYVFDATSSYTLAFSIAMGMMGLASLAMWIASPRKIRQVGREKAISDQS